MSGKLHGPTLPLMPADQASQLLDQVVHERVCALIDFCCLLDFEQELCRALVDCGLPHESVPSIAVDMIARALVRIGDDHRKLVGAARCRSRRRRGSRHEST
jgi:hypothetical protein